MPDANVVTPGVDRVVLFSVKGCQFGFRRPSQADRGEVARRVALKVAPVTGLSIEADIIAANGDTAIGSMWEWEARLEVGLVPRKDRDGKLRSLGEIAPTHWLDGDIVSFANVDPEEFEAVCRFLAESVFAPKNDQAQATSGASANG